MSSMNSSQSSIYDSYNATGKLLVVSYLFPILFTTLRMFHSMLPNLEINLYQHIVTVIIYFPDRHGCLHEWTHHRFIWNCQTTPV